MDSLLTAFLLFIAAIVALMTYMIVPYIPAVALGAAAAIALAIGVWWHWTQFSIDYRTSTWQEQLRNYASYVILVVVILLSYAFYVFGWGGVSGYINQARGAVVSASRRATSQISSGLSRTASAVSAIGEAAIAPMNSVASNMGAGANFFNSGRRSNSGPPPLE
jgi:hypothetical protein